MTENTGNKQNEPGLYGITVNDRLGAVIMEDNVFFKDPGDRAKWLQTPDGKAWLERTQRMARPMSNSELIVGKMDGVREYAEGYPVELRRDDRNGRLVVRALNEGGYNLTDVDLLDLLQWVKAHHPHLLVDRTD